MTKHMIIVLFLFTVGSMHTIPHNVTTSSPWVLGSLRYEGSFGSHLAPLYYEGNNIKPSSNKQKTNVDFEIPRSRGDQTYFILVTERVVPVAKETVNGECIVNTIDHLKVPKENDYRLYQLHLETEMVTNQHGKTEKINYWEVTEMVLPENGQVPAQTLIIYDLPERVLSFESGGSFLSWPTMHMHTPQKCDQSFIDRLNTMHLAAVDLNTIHIPIKKTVGYMENHKTVVIAFSS